MKNLFGLQRQRAFTLLEVLVAVVVFAVGLLAIASLQGNLMQSGNDAKARTIATSLAEEQVEQVRSFIDDDVFDGTVSSTTPESVTQGGVEFQRTFDIADYHYAEPGGSLESGADDSGKADAKLVSVTVAWCDAQAGSECDATDLSTDPNTVVVEDVIGRSSSPVGSARALSQLTNSTPPRLPYDPGDAPEVISIDLGDGKKKESPEPTIETTKRGCTGDATGECTAGDAVNNLTRVDAITYTPVLGEDEADNVRRQEFLIANCTCNLESAPADPELQGRTPHFWNGTDYVGGEKVSKPVGRSVGVNENDSILERICSDCCRDHHDVPGADIMYDHDDDGGEDTPKILSRFDPFRKDSEGNLVRHSHYAQNNQGDLIEVGVGEDYLEACRFIRIDGQFRLANDFRVESLQALPGNTCSDFSIRNKGSECVGTSTDVSSGWVENYQNYVADYLEDYFDAVKNDATYPASTPDLADTLAAAHNLPETDTPPTPPSAREIVSRALFIDYLTPDLINRIKCRQGSGTECDEREDPEGASVLALIPFFEVNVQLQANWTTSNGNLVNVVSEPVSDREYARGFVYEDDPTSSATDVVSFFEQGNVGLVDTHDIYPDTELVRDTLQYGEGDPSPGNPVVSGLIKIDDALTKGGQKVAPSDLNIDVQRFDGPDDCENDPAVGDESFICEMNEDASGVVSVSGYTKVEFKKDGSVKRISDNKVCLMTSSGRIIDGVTINDPDSTGYDPNSEEVTTFDFDMMDSPSDRTDYQLLVEPEDNPNCNPSIIN